MDYDAPNSTLQFHRMAKMASHLQLTYIMKIECPRFVVSIPKYRSFLL
jgi:hypothetical protein